MKTITQLAGITARQNKNIAQEKEKFVAMSNDGSTVEGVVSKRDVVKAVGSEVNLDVPISTIATTNVITVEEDTPYHEALRTMSHTSCVA